MGIVEELSAKLSRLRQNSQPINYTKVEYGQGTRIPVKKVFPLRNTPQLFVSKHQSFTTNSYTVRMEAWQELFKKYRSQYSYSQDIHAIGVKWLQRCSIRFDGFTSLRLQRLPRKTRFWVGPDCNPLKQVPLFPWALGKACLLEYLLPVDRSQPTAGFWKLATASEFKIHPPKWRLRGVRPSQDLSMLRDLVYDYPQPDQAVIAYLRKHKLQSTAAYLAFTSPKELPLSKPFESWILKRWIHQQ